MKLSSLLVTIAVVASWGLNAAIGKMGVMEVPPQAFLAIRFVIAGLLFLPFARVNKKQLKFLLLIALLLNVGHMGCIFIALKYLPASSASVLQQCEVPMALIVAWLFAGEKISLRQVYGIITAFAGILCIFGIPELNAVGFSAALAAGLFWALTQLAFKRAPHFSAASFLAYTSLFSVPFLGLTSYLFEKVSLETFSAAGGRFYFSMAYQVLVLGVAMMMWQRVVAENGINKVAPFTLLHIIFGIMGGMIFFDERLNPYIIAGAFLIIVGVALTTLKKAPAWRCWLQKWRQHPLFYRHH